MHYILGTENVTVPISLVKFHGSSKFMESLKGDGNNTIRVYVSVKEVLGYLTETVPLCFLLIPSIYSLGVEQRKTKPNYSFFHLDARKVVIFCNQRKLYFFLLQREKSQSVALIQIYLKKNS